MGQIKDRISILLELHGILRSTFWLLLYRERCVINGLQLHNSGKTYRVIDHTYRTISSKTSLYFYHHHSGYKYSYCYESCQFKIWKKDKLKWYDRRTIPYNKTNLINRLDGMIKIMMSLLNPVSLTIIK